MASSRDHGSRVSSARGSGSRRLRTALACNSCRTRKTKCNGARPVCDVCEGLGFECLYTISAHGPAAAAVRAQMERSMQTEQRLTALEDLLRQAIATRAIGNDNNEDSPPTDQQFRAAAWTPPSRHSQNVADLGSPGDIDNEDVVAVTPEIEHGSEDTVDGMGIVTFSDEKRSGLFGPTSNSALLQLITAALKQRAQAAPASESCPAYGYTSTPSVSRPTSPPLQSYQQGSKDGNPSALKVNSFILPVEPTMSRLINHFFKEIGLMFPYINEESVIKELSRLKSNGLYEVRRSWLCLVNTILAFSAYMCHGAEHQAQEGTEQNNSNDETKDSDIYLARALSLLPNMVFQSANLEILQSLLVLTQYMQGTKFSSSTWSFQRLSVQAAIQIGAHIPAPEKYSPLEQEIRNRCWHMCFILDRTCSMTFGRPPSIIGDNAQVPLPKEHEFSAFADGPTAIEISQSPSLTVTAYTQSIKLYRILGQIIDKVYQGNYRSAHENSYDAVLSNVIAQETHLGKWKAQLPRPLYIVSRDELAAHAVVPELSFSLSLMLTLRYLNARILLHRGIVESSFTQTQVSGGTGWNGLDVYGKQSIEMTVESASNIIDMVSSMTESQTPSLTTIWFLIYYVFNSAIIIFAVAALAATSSSIPPFLTGEEVLLKLQTASYTLDKLGNQTRIAIRCRKYLTRVIEIASTTVTTQQSTSLTENTLPGLHHFTTQAMESALNLDPQVLMPLSDIDFLAFADNNIFFT
ncbi:Fc.00g081400.m01.CDS01 [Cosmosporella sp. VM-42]